MDRSEFRRDVKRGSSFSDWRKDGKIIFVVHPQSKIGKRVRVQLRRVHTNDDGEQEIWSIWRFYTGKNDISKQFLDWLKANDDIDADETVLRIEAGGETEEYLKGELLGLDGYDWRKRLLKPRTEYLFSIFDITDKSTDPTDTEIVVLPYSAGKKLNKVWDDEIEERGEDEGDPWVTPYSCKVTFDNAERGTDMYGASAIRRPIPDSVYQLMETVEPADVMSYCDPAEEDSTEGTTKELLAAMCVVSCPLFETDVESEEAESAPPPAKKQKAPAKAPAKKAKVETKKPAAKKPAPPSKPKAPSKPKVPKETAAGEIPVEDCVEGEAYEYDGETLTFAKWDEKKNRGIFIDEDEMKVPVDAGETVTSLGNSEESEEGEEAESEETADAIEAKDCAKGCAYYDAEGRKLTFVRFNASKNKGVFKDEDDERVFLDADAPVSLDVSEVADALAPRTTKEATEQTEPEETEEGEPEEAEPEGDDEDMAQCPACEKLIPESSTKCPECGAEFADDEGDEIPFD